jgi:hypothetical protein
MKVPIKNQSKTPQSVAKTMVIEKKNPDSNINLTNGFNKSVSADRRSEEKRKASPTGKNIIEQSVSNFSVNIKDKQIMTLLDELTPRNIDKLKYHITVSDVHQGEEILDKINDMINAKASEIEKLNKEIKEYKSDIKKNEVTLKQKKGLNNADLLEMQEYAKYKQEMDSVENEKNVLNQNILQANKKINDQNLTIQEYLKKILGFQEYFLQLPEDVKLKIVQEGKNNKILLNFMKNQNMFKKYITSDITGSTDPKDEIPKTSV